MNKNTKMRLALIFFFVIATTTILLSRLIFLQLIRGKEFAEKALYQRLKLETINADRGRIFDRNGKELAISIPTPAVYADPSQIKDIDKTAKELAPVLGLSEAEIIELLKKEGNFVWLTRKLPVEKRAELNKLKISGIRIISLPRRFYPEGVLAGSTIGIAGIDNQGLEGIEVTYDRILAGEPGIFTVEKDPIGREIPVGFSEKSLPQNGADLYLTLDAVIQHRAERELEKAVLESNAKAGVIIAMDPHTGDILALAEFPQFDPNNFSSTSLSVRKNKAITESFEPGSTFKVFIAAAAIEEGIISPETEVFDPPAYQVGDRTIKCSRVGGHGKETFLEAMERSCNPIFAKLAAEDMDKDLLYKYIRGFGFGERSGIDFIGEAAGILAPKEQINQVGWANIGFGQGIAVTPLQLVRAMSAIVNGGYLLRPSLVSSYRVNGQLVEKEKEECRQVISNQTATILTTMLRSVVVNGSGSRADIVGFPVGGKTGTAQVAEKGGYAKDRFVVSFLGFAPIDDPQIVALVALFDPDAPQNYGGVIAAPVFQEFVSFALQHQGVRTRISSVGKVTVPNLVGKTREDAVKELTKIGLKGNIKGDGGKIASQEPRAGSLVESNATITLVCALQDKTETPRFIGLSLEEAEKIASIRGIKLNLKSGSDTTGIVVNQRPSAGQLLNEGETVELTIIAR